ncbi:Glycosyl transferase family 2, partial [Metamycoplasma alkalescens]
MKKKLTIIIPIYNPILPIEKILNNIYKQKSEDFNAIIVIDNPKNDHFYELDKLQNKNYENLKIIFNTSHQNFDIKLKEVLNFVETPYIYILYQNYKIKSEFIERINLFLENLETQPDLIEIPFSKKEFLYSIYKDEILPSLGLVELEKNNLPIALASQSIFNYIVKKEMIEEVINKW